MTVACPVPGTTPDLPLPAWVAGAQQATRPDVGLCAPYLANPAVITMAVGGASPPGLAANTPLAAVAVEVWRRPSTLATESLGDSCPEGGAMRHAYEGIHLASATSPPTVRPGELPTEQAAQPTVHTGRRGRMAGRGVWSPRTTLAYCWRSRTLLGLGAWLAVSPWTLGTIGDRHSTENALVNGVLLMGTAFWALLTRKPAPPHACGVSLGLWLLAAPSLWYFQSPVASHNSRAVGLAVVALSVWALSTGPRTRPPVDPATARQADGPAPTDGRSART